MYSTVVRSTILPVHSLYDELTSEGVVVYHRAGDDHSGAGIERERVKEPEES